MTNKQWSPAALAHELFTAAQLAPGEGIENAVGRLAALVEAQQPAPSAAADLIAALEEARSAINSMKVEAETAGQGDEQMMLEACETISNEGLQADIAIRAALASAPRPVPSAARPVTPYTCPKCHALWLHWPAEQTGFGRDTLNCRSADRCHYCEKAGVEQLQRLERIPAALHAPQPSPMAQAAPAAGAVAGSDDLSGTLRRLDSKELAAWVDRGMALSENLAMYVQADCTLRESQARDMLRAHLFSAQPAPAAPTSPAKAADSVLEDAARLDWLDQQCEAYGFQDIHEGNRWEISGAYANVRKAIDAGRAARKQGGA